MNAKFECRFEWLDAAGIRDDALARTFARLEVRVDNSHVTKALDRHTRSVVEGVHVSLLPIAAWIVDAWWTACLELPRRTIRSIRDARNPEEGAWHHRHGWLSSREGFCIPEVVFSRGDAGSVRMDWFQSPEPEQANLDAIPLEFLHSGTAFAPLDIVRNELERLVEGALARCEGLVDPLVDEIRARWNLICSATEDERRVCERAARLGLDAYDEEEVDDSLAELLARSDVSVVEPIVNDVLDAVDDLSVAKLERQISRLSALLEEAKTTRINESPPKRLDSARRRVANVHGLPWERGYQRARILRRDVLGLTDDVVAIALDRTVEETLLPPGAVTEDDDAFVFRRIRALTTTVRDTPFVVARPRQHSTTMRFDRARALYSLISSEVPRLVMDSRDADQQASRAFAAELLAPEGHLRSRLKSRRFVDQEEIDDLAVSLGVGPVLIKHQIENHHLAEVIDV